MDTYFFIFSVNRKEKEKFIYYFDRFVELMFKLYIFFNEIVDIELSSIIILLDIIHVIIYKGIKLKTISAFIRIRWFNKWNIEKIIKFQSKILRTFKKKNWRIKFD